MTTDRIAAPAPQGAQGRVGAVVSPRRTNLLLTAAAAGWHNGVDDSTATRRR